MKFCVTGGSGFIGRHLIDALHARYPGARIVNLDIRPPELPAPAEHLQGDITDAGAARRAVEGADCVINLAAAHSDFGIPRDEYFRINESGTRTLCDACTAAGVHRFIHYSSVAIYGSATQDAREDSPRLPENDYGRSKLASEGVVQQWVDAAPANTAVVIRPAVVVGPWHRANLYRLISQVDRGRFPAFFGAGDQIKSLVAVQNLAAFTASVVEPAPGDARLEAFNYVDYPQLSVRRTIEAIHEELGRRPPRITVPLGLGILAGKPFDLIIKLTGRNLPISSARVRKLATPTQFNAEKAAARFKPALTAEDGVRTTVRWYRSQKP